MFISFQLLFFLLIYVLFSLVQELVLLQKGGHFLQFPSAEYFIFISMNSQAISNTSTDATHLTVSIGESGIFLTPSNAQIFLLYSVRDTFYVSTGGLLPIASNDQSLPTVFSDRTLPMYPMVGYILVYLMFRHLILYSVTGLFQCIQW